MSVVLVNWLSDMRSVLGIAQVMIRIVPVLVLSEVLWHSCW